MKAVLRHLHRAVRAHSGAGLTDQQLLDRFLTGQDRDAFAALLLRHGRMVLAVCQRVLGDLHDAEDAFQATFLLLARKAPSLRSQRLLGGWLHGVAYRTSLKARTMMARRRARERQAVVRATEQTPGYGPSEELLQLLDQEVNRLPDKYRLPVVLCELEGQSRKAAATQLRIPEGTLSSRLAHAKGLLARKLSRHGTALTAGGLSAALVHGSCPACVPHALLHSTTGAALRIVAGEAFLAGTVSAHVLTLTEGVMKAMLLSKLKTFGAVALMLLFGAGATGLTYQPATAQPEKPSNTPQSTRVAEEIEELRLDVAALRKGLEVTRERVKTLEGEVQTLRAGRQTLGGTMGGGSGSMTGSGSRGTLNRKLGEQGSKSAAELLLQDRLAREANNQQSKSPADLLSAAEAALQAIRTNFNDKQAAEFLERALKQIKEHPATKADVKPR